MFTRKQYLNKECTFAQFYEQFVTNETRIGAKNVANAISESCHKIDSALNQYGNLRHWDFLAANVRIPLSVYNEAYEKTDNTVWISDKLCILKLAVNAELLKMGWIEILEMNEFGHKDAYLVKEAI